MEKNSDTEQPLNDSDLFSQENWGGKADPHIFYEDKFDTDEEEDACSHRLSGFHNDHDYTISEPEATKDYELSDTELNFQNHVKNHEISNDTTELKVDSNKEDMINVANINEDKKKTLGGIGARQKKKADANEKRPCETKFFSSCPEVTFMNQLKTYRKKPHLLRNGNLCLAVRGMPGGLLHVRNTCGFDSIVQILYTSAVDYCDYKLIMGESDVPLFAFVKNFIKSGPKAAIYKERATILKSIYEDRIKISSTDKRVIVREMDVADSVSNIWENMMKSQPSVHRMIHCNKCGESSEPITSFYEINHSIIVEKGFGALQSAIRFSPVTHNQRCFSSDCNGRTTRILSTNFHIFIELDVKRTPTAPSESCKLEDIPIHLTFNNKKYRFGTKMKSYIL